MSQQALCLQWNCKDNNVKLMRFTCFAYHRMAAHREKVSNAHTTNTELGCHCSGLNGIRNWTSQGPEICVRTISVPCRKTTALFEPFGRWHCVLLPLQNATSELLLTMLIHPIHSILFANSKVHLSENIAFVLAYCVSMRIVSSNFQWTVRFDCNFPIS